MTKIAKVTSGIVCANGPNAGHYVDARAIGYGGMIMLAPMIPPSHLSELRFLG